MPLLRALVGEVWPYRLGPLSFGADLVLHVVTGTLEAGERVEVSVGPGRTRRGRVESVATADPAAAFVQARIALPGVPPTLGARLEVRLPDVSPTEVVVMGTLASAATPEAADGPAAVAGEPPTNPTCAWAAVFEAMRRFEDGLALVALLEEDAALLANGQPPDYFLGCLASERAVAAVVADRLRALFGGGDADWNGAQFLRATRGALEPTADERAAFVERLRAAGVALTVPD